MQEEAAEPQNPRSALGAWVGRYQLIELLGVGGMAEVFKARTVGPSGAESTVVIKRIHPDFGNDPILVKMFVAEARILGLLQHPNVVKAYDFGEADGHLFLVLEFVDGPSLNQVMDHLYAVNRQVTPGIAAYIAHQVCSALSYVHTLCDADGNHLQVVHGDVTPSNIVLASSGMLKLLDFGVAKYRRSKVYTSHGAVQGKPGYLSPEALAGKAIDARLDLFSLGVVLHELLTLNSLFAGDDSVALTIEKVSSMPIEPPSTSRADVPPALDAVVMRALCRDVDRRYGSAAEMAHDLNEILIATKLSASDVAEFTREMMTVAPSARSTAAVASTIPIASRQTIGWHPPG